MLSSVRHPSRTSLSDQGCASLAGASSSWANFLHSFGSPTASNLAPSSLDLQDQRSNAEPAGTEALLTSTTKRRLRSTKALTTAPRPEFRGGHTKPPSSRASQYRSRRLCRAEVVRCPLARWSVREACIQLPSYPLYVFFHCSSRCLALRKVPVRLYKNTAKRSLFPLVRSP